MFLTMILGPMFAGKTTYLINKYKECEGVLTLKPSVDTRYDEVFIESHDHKKIPTKIIKNIMDLKLEDIKKYKTILIDEGQFFVGLNDWIRSMDEFEGRIYVSGLNGDFKRESFGEINKLISRCDDIIHLKAICSNCKKEASFSLKKIKDEKQVDVGGEDKYVPVCGECYSLYNQFF